MYCLLYNKIVYSFSKLGYVIMIKYKTNVVIQIKLLQHTHTRCVCVCVCVCVIAVSYTHLYKQPYENGWAYAPLFGVGLPFS